MHAAVITNILSISNDKCLVRLFDQYHIYPVHAAFFGKEIVRSNFQLLQFCLHYFISFEYFQMSIWEAFIFLLPVFLFRNC